MPHAGKIKNNKKVQNLEDRYEGPNGEFSKMKDGYDTKIHRINQQNLSNVKDLSAKHQEREDEMYNEVKAEKKRLNEKFEKK